MTKRTDPLSAQAERVNEEAAGEVHITPTDLLSGLMQTAAASGNVATSEQARIMVDGLVASHRAEALARPQGTWAGDLAVEPRAGRSKF